MEEESNPNETSDKTNKSASKSSSTKSNKQKQQKFQEETPDEGSNHQQERTEEESNPNKISDKTNKSTSKSSFTKLNKQKQQRFQEETPSEGSKRQQGRMEEESDLNETSDKTNKSTSKSTPIKSTLKSAKSTKLTQEESDDEVIEIEPPNIPIKVVKDDQGNEKVIDDDDTDLEAENLKLKKRIDEVQKKLEEERSGSNNNDEYDKKEVGVEMKSILKIIDETRGLDYNKTFNSVKNLKIRHKLVSELRSALAPCFPALNKQLTKWLGCLHKSSYSHQRLMDREKANENKHQVYSNNRVHDVAKRLYSFDDERITKYDKHRLLKMLSNRLFHSPEISETDEEDLTKSIIAIYDYSWRSDELKNLLRNVFDVHSLNKAKLIREHRYDDEGFNTEYDEVEEVSRGTTPATGNTTENDEDHNKEGKEKPSNQR
ncbi:6235_t:CDS:2, partial [Rhizophagus irregularis]